MVTRQELRRQVGLNIGAYDDAEITVRDAEYIDHPFTQETAANFAGSYIFYRDKQYQVTGLGGNTEEFAFQIDPQLSADDFTAGDTVELWSESFPPRRINEAINQSLIEAIRHVYLDMDPIYECISARNFEFDLDEGVLVGTTTSAKIAMVQTVFRRRILNYQDLYYSQIWDSDTNGLEIAQDLYDYRYQPAIRVDVPAGGGRLTLDTALRDLSGLTQLEGWFKTTVDQELDLELREGSAIKETVDISLDDADGWKYHFIDLANPADLQKIDNLAMDIPSGPGVLWLNGMWGINEPSIYWDRLDRRVWRIDKNTRTLVVRPRYLVNARGPFSGLGFTDTINWPIEDVVKIIVGADPQRLEEDDDETEVDSQFIIARSTNLLFSSVSGGRGTDPQNYRQQSGLWHQRAEQAKARFSRLVNIRRIN